MPVKNVVVVGSGPGGSAFAALMAHAGHQVTLLERNHFPGGKCSSLSRKGFVLDNGVHMFGRGDRGPFGEISRILGEGPRWSAAAPAYTANLRGESLNMCTSLVHPLTIINLIKGRMGGRLNLGLFSTALKSYKALGGSGLRSLAARFRDPRYPLYCEQQNMTVRDFFISMSDSEDLLRAIHCQAMVTMALPWHRASQGEFSYILASTMRGNNLSYPMGGCGEIPASFLRALRRRGGDIRLGSEVISIEVESGCARGITTQEGDFIPADLVVSNAGLKRTIAMAGREHFHPEYLEYTDGLRESEAFIAAKFLLGRRIQSLSSPCMLHLPDLPPESMFDYLDGGAVPSDLFLFITLPRIWDTSLVPPGKDVLIIGAPAPVRPESSGLGEKILDRAEEMIADIFPEMVGSIEDKQRIYTPGISSLSGRETGECIGLAQEVGQSGTSRPGPSLPLQGLFVVGTDAGGRGIGTECAAESAIYLYNLLKDGSAIMGPMEARS
jgi:prolycopene isomerase